ncbi:MAG TPA: hypothetical protein VF847_04720, partial [Candidatus Deferrimicrobiaceae bacterium]
MTLRKSILIALLLGLVSSASAAPPRKEAPVAPAPSAPVAPEKPAAAPVVLEGKTLFLIRESALGASPEERASEISKRLEKLVKDRTIRPDSIRVVDEELASLVVAEGVLVLRVFERDAAAEGATRQALAARHAEAIRTAVEAHNREYGFRSLLIAAIYGVVATGVLVVILLLYHYLFPRIYAGIREWSRTRIRSVQIGSYELLGATRLMGFLNSLVRWFRILTTALLVYSWL